MSAPRDRDAAGRARNARPRDASGRPLERGAAGQERASDEVALDPETALGEAERLLQAGEPFAAHDVLEGVWKARRAVGESDTAWWQGLAQVAVGLTHLQRGNAVGAARLLERGALNIGPCEFTGWALRLGAAIEGGDEKALAGVLNSRPDLTQVLGDR